MSLTKAEQIIALYRGGMGFDEITSTLATERSYVTRCLFDAGLRSKAYTHGIVEADLPPRVNRDPCSYCNVRADIGCRHTRIAA